MVVVVGQVVLNKGQQHTHTYTHSRPGPAQMDTPFNPYLILHTHCSPLSLSSKRRQKKRVIPLSNSLWNEGEGEKQKGEAAAGRIQRTQTHITGRGTHTTQASSFSLFLSRCFAAKKLVITSVELPVSRASFVQPVVHLRSELHFDPHRHLPQHSRGKEKKK